MRTTSKAIGGGLVLGALTLAVTRMSAQTDWAPADDTLQEAIVECLLSRTPVQNAPFSADAAILWQPPASSGRSEMRASSRYYRNREGRVRVEQGFAGTGLSSKRVIVAAADGRVYDMDPIARTIDITLHFLAEMMVGSGCQGHFVLPLARRRFVDFFQRPLDRESLGEQSVAGVDATGTRFTTDLPQGVFSNSRAERWVSPELKLVVYLRWEEPNMGTFDYRLTRISRTEPPAELFEAPAGCEVILPENGWPHGCNGEPASTAKRPLDAGGSWDGWASPYTALKKLPR